MKTKNFEQVIRKFTEEFKEYCDGKDIQESAKEREVLLMLGTNNKMDTYISIIRGSEILLARIIADKMIDDDSFYSIVAKAVDIYCNYSPEKKNNERNMF